MQPTLTTLNDGLQIRWPDATLGEFPYIWLRDTDPSGFHPQTGERTFDLTSVSLDITPEQAVIQGEDLVLTWNEQEVSTISLAWLKAHRPGQRRADPAAIAPLPWRAELTGAGVPRYSAAAIMSDREAFSAWLTDTKRYGVSIVTSLADNIEAGMDVARKVGHLRETNFGVNFEVVSKPDPNNLAYTSLALPLHTDLTNQELPPGYQFLHCLANEATGGGSTFCDGVAVANDLKLADPDAFDVLATAKVPFRFHDRDTDIRSRKAVIILDDAGDVSEICFNAHLADIVDLEPRQLRSFYRAYRRFMSMLRDPFYGISLRLAKGEMVVFDNRRVLHGREAFDPSTGQRHLNGCYVDRGEWDSRIRVLAR